MPKRYFIYFSYNGAAYCGWQRQPNALSVQETLEKVLSTMWRQDIYVTGAGRTDAGVHARQMVAHFDAEIVENTETIHRINAFLPKDIAVQQIREVTSEAHARFDAISRTYRYYLSLEKNPFDHLGTYYYPYSLDWRLMNSATQKILNHRNFQCFCKARTDVKTDICNVSEAVWELQEERLVFTITADRFLRNMVRAVVGTLLEIGRDRKPLSWLDEVLQSGNRCLAGASVPAQALYLEQIRYPSRLFL